MDSEPDAFSCVLPLPFRLQVEFILALWLWATDLHALSLLKIDGEGLIGYSSRYDNEPPLHICTYRLAALLSTLWTVAISGFWLITRGDPQLVVLHQWIPNSLAVLLVIILVAPRPAFLKRFYGTPRNDGTMRLLRGLGRVSYGGIERAQPFTFADVLLADVLTSFAKPISEVFLAIAMVLNGKSTTAKPERQYLNGFLVATALSWPFLIRLLQCRTVGQTLNAIKYATAFPVIWLAAVEANHSYVHFARLCFAFINSGYSFWWDLTMDWDLTLLTRPIRKPFGLRERSMLVPLVYYVAIGLDFFLRLTWSVKLSLAIVWMDGIEGGVFLLEVLELLRRWMWVFLRMETEYSRQRPLPVSELALL